MTGYAVIINPTAGRARSVVSATRSALDAHSIAHDIHVPADVGQLATVVEAEVAAGRRSFVAVGGDGTVNALVNELMRFEWNAPPILGVLPAGTGCDLVRTFAIPQDIRAAAAHLAGTSTYLVDVGQVEGSFGSRYFLNVGQAGVAAAAARSAANVPAVLGRRRYILGFVGALPGFRRTEVVVEAGRRRFEGEALAVIFANGQFFGGGFNIAPRATLVDGELDVQVFSARKRDAARLVPRVARGMHLRDPTVRRFSVPEVSIETALPWPVEVDGDFVGNTPIVARVVPGQISLKI